MRRMRLMYDHCWLRCAYRKGLRSTRFSPIEIVDISIEYLLTAKGNWPERPVGVDVILKQTWCLSYFFWGIWSVVFAQEPNISALQVMLKDRDPEIRVKAAEGLGRVGGNQAITALSSILTSDKVGAVQIAAAEALGFIGGSMAMSALSQGFNAKSSMVRKRIVESLKDAGTVRSIPYLQSAFADKDEGVRLHATLMLKIIGHRNGVPLLGKFAISDKSSSVRAAAASYMGRVGVKDSRAVGILAKVIESESDPTVRMRAVESLGFLQLPAEKLTV